MKERVTTFLDSFHVHTPSVSDASEIYWTKTCFIVLNVKSLIRRKKGAKTFKPNKYVLSFMERIAADAEDTKEVTEQLLEKYELVQDIFTQKKRNISELKRKMIDTNKTCRENLEQKRQYFLKKINERFDEMAGNIDSATQHEILIFDKDLENLDKFTEKLGSLKIRIENKGKGEKGSCAVHLEQFKNVAELPLNVYQHCEYQPEDQDADFFTRTCGYLSTEQQQYKGTMQINLTPPVFQGPPLGCARFAEILQTWGTP